MLFQSYIPLSCCVEAFSIVINTINQLPTLVLDGLSPCEVQYGKPSTYENFHPFGFRVFPYLRDYVSYKFASRSIDYTFLGYRISPKVFRCLDPFIQLKSLACAQLFDSKSVSAPMIVFQWLTSEGDSFSDPTLYRSMVARLQYLTITLPHFAHAVNFVSQYM